MSNTNVERGYYYMKIEELKQMKKQQIINGEVLNVYYNICKYYNKDSEIINKYLIIKRGN